MNNDRYVFDKISEIIIYGFFSKGPKGDIQKRVQFQLTEEASFQLFNIGFGDVIDEKETIDDMIVSDNGDREKILMTVTAIVIDFIQGHIDASTLIEGATASRTRLYQKWLSRFFNQFDKDFLIPGYVKKHWQPFKKGVNYESFLIKRK